MLNGSGWVAGERLTITFAGRPAAVLGQVSPRSWREWDDLTGVFGRPTDPAWAGDRDLMAAEGRTSPVTGA
ncbi:type II toxin-antitoxin system prevent-host-death family antitoxin [Micromonospora sp. WMMD714]|uniref:type II toxin-antitoxin system prevent-host-death family antitoxin n=1 Tax=Micromonospora sp. WMMD714 TaxID=3016097 RepID=UPI0032B40AA2